MDSRSTDRCCSKKPLLTERPLMTEDIAQEIQALFKLLSNSTRLRMLHTLVLEGELKVGDLAKKIGMKPQAVSNQLQKLTDRRILFQRRAGLNVYYSIADSCLTGLLEQGLCLIEEAQNNTGERNLK